MNPGDDVTLGEVYRAVLQLRGQLDTVTGDHEQRIRKLEQWKYALPLTILTSAGAVIAALVQG